MMTAPKNKILLPEEKRAPLHSASLVRWILFFIRPYQRIIAPFMAYRLVRFTYFAALPAVFGLLIDAFEQGKVQQSPDFYIGMMALYGFFYMLMQASNQIFTFEVAAWERALRGMTLFSINHITRLPLDWHESQGSGGKLQRIMTARKAFDGLNVIIRWTFMPVLGACCGILLSVIALDMPLYYILFYAGFFGSYCLASWYFGRPIRVLYDSFHQKLEKLLSGVYEFVSGIRTVKAFTLQNYIFQRGLALEGEGQHAIEKVIFRMFTRWAIMNTIGCLWIAIFAGVGFWSVYHGNMSIGTYAATFFLAASMWNMLENVASVQEQLYEYDNGLRRLIDTLRTPVPALDIEPVTSLDTAWRTINFDKLSFVYSDKEAQGVHDISFSVQRGEKIAFVGSSGARKTTLAKLLMKQMLPNSGTINVDDTGLSHIPSGQWLNQIGFVPQDVELFNLSIRENILIDRDDIEDEDYQNVLRQSALYDFVAALPEGDNTIIGERGIKLSGGQRQRLGIARALIRNTPIMVFDEATSSLDSLSEQQIQQAIDVSFAGRTVFLIAHRLSTVRHVDKIIVLEKGRIIEQGSFDELLAHNGMFAKLWSLQSR